MATLQGLPTIRIVQDATQKHWVYNNEPQSSNCIALYYPQSLQQGTRDNQNSNQNRVIEKLT